MPENSNDGSGSKESEKAPFGRNVCKKCCRLCLLQAFLDSLLLTGLRRLEFGLKDPLFIFPETLKKVVYIFITQHFEQDSLLQKKMIHPELWKLVAALDPTTRRVRDNTLDRAAWETFP